MSEGEEPVSLRSIEIVADHSAASRCDEGFLRLARLELRNVYSDGSESRVYRCDVLSRPGSDAVVAVLFEIDAQRRIRVLLRDAARPPVYLRRHKVFEQPDPRVYESLLELVAGMIESGDGPGIAGLQRRAAVESEEEAGIEVPSEIFSLLGGEAFASPGTSDEKLFYCAGAVDLGSAHPGRGDGSVMEERAQLRSYELSDAIEACRTGEIPDLKTEVGLLRLADHLGYLPQLRCFVDELPPALAERYTRLGIEPRTTTG